MRVAIIGSSAAGLFASLLLARAGHEVLLFEQERIDPPADVKSAAERAFRWTAPQIVQPHIVMARCCNLLRERMPDVYAGLLAAGVAEVPLSAQMPCSLADTSIKPGDEDLSVLMTRRSALDWVLQRTILLEPRVTPHGGTRVTGLQSVDGTPPQVTGIRTDTGNYAADLVVDATARRSSIDRWLATIGALPSATSWAECGVAYFSRHYRLRTGVALPGPAATRAVVALDEFTVGICGADNGTMQLALAPLATDHRFRSLRDPEVFDAVLRAVAAYAAWLDVLDPISPVFPMGGLHKTHRRLVVDGAAVVTGLHALGDSVCTTNPTLGRRPSVALWGAVDLLDVLELHPHDGTDQALAVDERVARHIAPFYEDQATIDSARLAMLRNSIFGTPIHSSATTGCQRVSYVELRIAAQFDRIDFRALWSLLGMMRLPDEVYADPSVVSATRSVIGECGTLEQSAQPSRAQILAALGASVPPPILG